MSATAMRTSSWFVKSDVILGSWNSEQAALALLWASSRAEEGSDLHRRLEQKRRLLKAFSQALEHAAVRDEFQ